MSIPNTIYTYFIVKLWPYSVVRCVWQWPSICVSYCETAFAFIINGPKNMERDIFRLILSIHIILNHVFLLNEHLKHKIVSFDWPHVLNCQHDIGPRRQYGTYVFQQIRIIYSDEYCVILDSWCNFHLMTPKFN